jgi:hypothetical protein
MDGENLVLDIGIELSCKVVEQERFPRRWGRGEEGRKSEGKMMS